jgi:prepilin-type N-terminal cleavage/methylation domain-containing protein
MSTQHIKQNNFGFTLLELIVGMGIFSIVLLSVTGIFQQVINAQRRAVGAQNIQENVSYVMEVMAKEIRTAKRNFTTCADVPGGQIFAVTSGTLYLRNQHDECVAYFLENNRIKIARDGVEQYVTADDVSVDYLNFSLKSDGQPAVTVMLGVSTLDTSATGSDIAAQTTISSRYYLQDEILQ